LARPAAEIRLADVVRPFESVLQHPQCLTRPDRCNPAAPCAAHSLWTEATDGVAAFFRDTTLAAVAS
jgi:DNA-binding IscR family transcriptional regulator